MGSAAGREGAHAGQPQAPCKAGVTRISQESLSQPRPVARDCPMLHLPLSEKIILKLASSLLWICSENKDHFNF